MVAEICVLGLKGYSSCARSHMTTPWRARADCALLPRRRPPSSGSRNCSLTSGRAEMCLKLAPWAKATESHCGVKCFPLRDRMEAEHCTRLHGLAPLETTCAAFPIIVRPGLARGLGQSHATSTNLFGRPRTGSRKDQREPIGDYTVARSAATSIMPLMDSRKRISFLT